MTQRKPAPKLDKLSDFSKSELQIDKRHFESLSEIPSKNMKKKVIDNQRRSPFENFYKNLSPKARARITGICFNDDDAKSFNGNRSLTSAKQRRRLERQIEQAEVIKEIAGKQLIIGDVMSRLDELQEYKNSYIEPEPQLPYRMRSNEKRSVTGFESDSMSLDEFSENSTGRKLNTIQTTKQIKKVNRELNEQYFNLTSRSKRVTVVTDKPLTPNNLKIHFSDRRKRTMR